MSMQRGWAACWEACWAACGAACWAACWAAACPLLPSSQTRQTSGCPLPAAGHSLGGALAVLASLEIARQHPASHVTCYTFGSPRVGGSGSGRPLFWGVWQAGVAPGGVRSPGGRGLPSTALFQRTALRLRVLGLHNARIQRAANALPAVPAAQVGNTAFADEYDEAVPDTWAILNGVCCALSRHCLFGSSSGTKGSDRLL